MNQLPRDMRNALAANARTKLVLACSPEDAQYLERHFEPHLSAHDLQNLNSFQAACCPCLTTIDDLRLRHHIGAYRLELLRTNDRMCGSL